MGLSFERRTIFKDTPDREGLLVTQERELVALLIRCSEIHEVREGEWYVEWAYRDELRAPKTFRDLDSAASWISQRISEISN